MYFAIVVVWRKIALMTRLKKKYSVLDRNLPCSATSDTRNTVWHWNDHFSRLEMKYYFLIQFCIRYRLLCGLFLSRCIVCRGCLLLFSVVLVYTPSVSAAHSNYPTPPLVYYLPRQRVRLLFYRAPQLWRAVHVCTQGLNFTVGLTHKQSTRVWYGS